ncbi:MAG: tRNA uridine-5-carboxymethylaminomethyl(34) synthesis GTPase MnmE [Gammaproteobacteria bacterium]|nr:tRNA uridine-5-carboxymethylaminomethyl(34) synthesis GTPase MnmE [Gammaproteobacteria bacterium]
MKVPRQDDTIVARATPPGRGGIAVIRVSGPGVGEIATSMLGELPEPRRAELRKFVDATGEPIDSGIALLFPAPHSFTGEDVLELQGHGGTMVCDLLIERAIELGARIAEPGEFSRRAFLNDRMDLAQAEAIADLIDSSSRSAARAAQRSLRGDFSDAITDLNESVTQLRTHVEAAIDFPEEEIDFLQDAALLERIIGLEQQFRDLERVVRQGCLLRDGVTVVVAGRPNVGKSSLLNALAGYDVAIVTDVSGTTRDLVHEQLDLDGLPLHVVDTAGLRAWRDPVEEEGIRRARAELRSADHALIVLDANRADHELDALTAELPDGLGYTVVRNKIDLTGESAGPVADGSINVSALERDGIEALRNHLKSVLGYEPPAEGAITARRRHLESLARARQHFDQARQQLEKHAAGELMAEELLQVQNALAEITGEFHNDDLLGRIFSSFCIGK